MSTAGLLAVEAGLVLALVTALWAVSLALRDSSIVDVFWGSGFVVVAWVGFALADGSSDRRLLLAVLVTAWGLRLTVYLARRNLGKGEDYRYAEMRRRHGERWPLRSLVVVFWLQGALMWVVSLRCRSAMSDPTPAGLGALDWVGAALWAVGLAFESRRRPAAGAVQGRPGQPREGDGPGPLALHAPPELLRRLLRLVGDLAGRAGHRQRLVDGGRPGVMSVLLIRVSGAALLERSLSRRREGYADYVARTSAFFPWPPRR